MNRMAGKSWVNVGVFVELNEAQILETILVSRGFKARTHFDKALQLFLFLRPPRKAFRVQVLEREFGKAMDLLEVEPGLAAKLDTALHCPDCGSLRVEYPQMTRKFILPTVLLHLGIIFHVIEHECYCENCHCIWNLPKQITPPVRAPASP